MTLKKWTGLGALVLSGIAYAGPYVGGAGLISERENYDDLDRAHGAKGFVGYRFDNAPLILELAYLDAGEAKAADTGGATLGYSGVQASAGWFAKLSPTGSGVWLKGGYYSGDSEVKDPSGFAGSPGATYKKSTSGLAVGLGGDWKLTPWFGLRFDLEGLLKVKDFANDENMTTYSLGLVFELPTAARPAPASSYRAPLARVAELEPVEASRPEPVYAMEPAPVTPLPLPDASVAAPAAPQSAGTYTVASGSYNMSAETAPPVPASATAAWLPGSSARAAQGLTLRKRPAVAGDAAATVPAGATLQLLGRQSNAEGTWWLMAYENARGWALQTSLAR